MKHSNKRNSIELIIILLVVSTACMIPCMGSQIPLGDDMTFHILRVESVYDALRNGAGFPAYVYPKLLEGYGYAAGIFYPDILLLPAVFFRFMGASPELAMKLYIWLILLFTCFTSYQAGKQIGKNWLTGIITMILYTMGHYHLEDIYRRSAMGEVVAMAFVPLVFWALYDFTESKRYRKGLLCIAFTGLLLCHTISFILCAGVAVIWVLVRWKKVWNKEHVVGLLLEAGVCILITAFYWIPVLEQFASGTFYVSTNPAFETQDEMMTLLGILTGRLSVSFAEIGIFVLLLMLGIKEQVRNKKAIVCLILAAALLLIETPLFPWKLIDKTPLVSIQFPWRLNIFTEFFVAFGIGMQIKELYNHHLITEKLHRWSVVFSILIGIFNLCIVWQVEILLYADYLDSYLENPANTNEIGFCEWLPSEADRRNTIYSEEKGLVRFETETFAGAYDSDGSFSFESKAAGTYIVPKYYYKGYAAVAFDANGKTKELDVEKDTETALVRVTTDEAETVRVFYRATDLQNVSKWISVLTLILLFGIWIVNCTVTIFQKRSKRF